MLASGSHTPTETNQPHDHILAASTSDRHRAESDEVFQAKDAGPTQPPLPTSYNQQSAAASSSEYLTPDEGPVFEKRLELVSIPPPRTRDQEEHHSDASRLVILPPIRSSHSTGADSGNQVEVDSRLSLNLNEDGQTRYSGMEPDQDARDAQTASDGAERKLEEDAQHEEEERLLVTSRFQHAQDEDGHHVILGHDGQPTRCEDEPIHIPGAVQGFGVIIALREDEDAGNFVVRQVSENATEVLGLSPKYLFSLACFTDSLPDDQADMLYDNLRFLANLARDSISVADNSPQVFLLSGYGEPGSDPTVDPDVDEMRRRRWTTWCAMHRPSPTSVSMDDVPLLVLEFELESDVLNPLYPVSMQPNESSGDTSRSGETATSGSGSGGDSGSGSGSGGGSGDSLIGSFGSTSDTAIPPSEAASSQSMTVRGAGDGEAEEILATVNSLEIFAGDTPKLGLDGDETWYPRPEDVLASTTSHSKPLRELERIRAATSSSGSVAYQFGMRIVSTSSSRSSGAGPSSSPTAARSVSSMSTNSSRRRRLRDQGQMGGWAATSVDVFTVLAQANSQLSSAQDLETFLKIVVGIVKDLTQFHRVLVYQFDEQWNGQTVAELVDWSKTHDLYMGLNFPASDIPKQARDLYAINRVRLLYDRSQQTARLVCKSEEDLLTPLDMTHSFLRAMSPIHVKYLANMGVRASMSISIMAFGQLWGLVACHSYGDAGMRVSFPMRHMLRLLSDSIAGNIERLSYEQRLHTRKLVSTMPTDRNPAGYIISNAEDLLSLFDADFGVLVVGDGAKIMGENNHGQETFIIAEYLRSKQFPHMLASKCLSDDYPDLKLPLRPEVVAGMLYVPLSSNGTDFIVFLRQSQLRHVHWAGKPFKGQAEHGASLEPRKSFKAWSQTIQGKSRGWTDEQLETAGVLALVYGKFIEVWRQKETALHASRLTNLLLSNAGQEIRTPLNQIINYLELALNGPLDDDTRDNLTRSHAASKSLLFTINDLLDLTRLESGRETSFNEPFDLQTTVTEAAKMYQNEAVRRGLEFVVDITTSPKMVWGDSKKIRTVVANLTANAVKYTDHGSVRIQCGRFNEPPGLRDDGQVAVEIVVADTGRGIAPDKLSNIFRQFENVQESDGPSRGAYPGLGLGLAVVARIVEQLGGQLRVESEQGTGSQFSFLMPFILFEKNQAFDESPDDTSPLDSASNSSVHAPSTRSSGSRRSQSEVDSLVQALTSPLPQSRHNRPGTGSTRSNSSTESLQPTAPPPHDGMFPVTGSRYPIRGVKMHNVGVEAHASSSSTPRGSTRRSSILRRSQKKRVTARSSNSLRVLVVDDNPIVRKLLMTRLGSDGYQVSQCIDGTEAVDIITVDRNFDCILMDIQMPTLNGFEAAEQIRSLERQTVSPSKPLRPSAGSQPRMSVELNGRIPLFAVSASLAESQRDEMIKFGMDGWIMKPIDYERMSTILNGIIDTEQRKADLYEVGCKWAAGGWLVGAPTPGSDTSDDKAPSTSRLPSSSSNPSVSTQGGTADSSGHEDGAEPPSDYELPSPPERADTPDEFLLPSNPADG